MTPSTRSCSSGPGPQEELSDDQIWRRYQFRHLAAFVTIPARPARHRQHRHGIRHRSHDARAARRPPASRSSCLAPAAGVVQDQGHQHLRPERRRPRRRQGPHPSRLHRHRRLDRAAHPLRQGSGPDLPRQGRSRPGAPRRADRRRCRARVRRARRHLHLVRPRRRLHHDAAGTAAEAAVAQGVLQRQRLQHDVALGPGQDDAHRADRARVQPRQAGQRPRRVVPARRGRRDPPRTRRRPRRRAGRQAHPGRDPQRGAAGQPDDRRRPRQQVRAGHPAGRDAAPAAPVRKDPPPTVSRPCE